MVEDLKKETRVVRRPARHKRFCTSMEEIAGSPTRNITFCTLFLVLIAYAAGCATQSKIEREPSHTPEEVTITAVTLESPIDSLQEATMSAATLEPPRDTVQLEPQACISDASNQNDNLSHQWMPLANNLRQINNISHPIESLSISADGRWLVGTLQVGVQNQIPILATWMIDTVQDKHLQLNSDMEGNAHLTNWFSDSQLLWVTENGDIAVGNGEVSQNLNAPTQMAEVWYAADGVGFAGDVDGIWWRVIIEDKAWESVSMTDSESLRGLGALGVSADAAYALLFQPEKIWHIPINFGDAVTEIGEPDLSLVGTDAGFAPAVVQLGNESLDWFISAPIWYTSGEQDPYPLDGFMLSTVEMRLLMNMTLGFPTRLKLSVIKRHPTANG